MSPPPGAELDLAACRAALRSRLPAALVPTLAVVDALPTRGSGKVDRDALPWPLPSGVADEDGAPSCRGRRGGWPSSGPASSGSR